MKTCTKCKATRSVSLFVRDKHRSDGLYPVCKECRKAYHLSNRAHILAKQRRYNATHQEEIKESHKRYAAKRFFYIRARNLMLKGPGPWASEKELASLWKKQRGLCAMTGRRLTRETAHLDHVIPFTKNGSSAIENLRWVDRNVNYAKRDLNDADFLALCREVIEYLSRCRERS